MTNAPNGARVVTVQMTERDAERFSYALSDILCWARGFQAARRGTDLDQDMPIGVDEVRNLNIRLKEALQHSTKEKQ